jgi:hypothetical protein
MCYFPQATGTSVGQVHTLVAVLISGAFLYDRSGVEGRAGVLIGVATLLKLFPAFGILAFLTAGRRRTALVATAVCLYFVLLTLQEHYEYVQRYVLKGFYPVAAACFVSVPAMSTRLFTANSYAIAAFPSMLLYRSVVACGTGVILLGMAWLFRRRPSA